MTTENDAIPPVGTVYVDARIAAMTGIEAVRHRPGMYIGDTGTDGLHYLFKIIIDNFIDEAVAGHCTEIKVIYGTDDSLSVEDNGRGISVELNEETGKTWLELFFVQLSHRGIFGNKGGFGDSVYQASLFNIGAAAVNALSTRLECEVRQGGKIHQQRFERGVPTGPLTVVGECGAGEHGTKITWLADDTVFKLALTADGKLDYRPDRLRNRIRELAYLNKEVSISFHDAHSGTEPETYHYPRGIADYVAYLNESRGGALSGDLIYFCELHEQTRIEVAIQYSRSDEEVIRSFVNHIFLSKGGTHITGFKTALTRTINRSARKNGLLQKGEGGFPGEVIRAGVTTVISLRMVNPSFARASKDELTNPEMTGIVNRAVGKGLSRFLDENPQAADVILGRIAASAKARGTN